MDNIFTNWIINSLILESKNSLPERLFVKGRYRNTVVFQVLKNLYITIGIRITSNFIYIKYLKDVCVCVYMYRYVHVFLVLNNHACQLYPPFLPCHSF